MSHSTAAINAHHQDEIAKFLKFFRSRLKTHLENVDADFEDTQNDRLSADDVYSQKDIQDVLRSLSFAVKANIRSELQDTINMMALLLRQIFAEAEESRLALDLDIGQVEDKELLERVEKLSVAEWADASSSTSPKAKRSGAKAPDPHKQRELELRQQHEDELRAAQHTSQAQQEEHTRALKRLQRQLDEARETIDDLERKVTAAQQHVAQTPQFQAMKKMVTQKNQQLDRLRRRLLKYEPDAAAEDDDGDETKNADDDDDDE